VGCLTRTQPPGPARQEESLIVDGGEVLLSYVEGRYLWLNAEGLATAAAVGHPDPLGMRIFDVAPDLQLTAFGARLAEALDGGPSTAVCEGMAVIFPGSRLSARIEPREDGVFVRFLLAPADAPGLVRVRRRAT
jgi:hypothetical protein